MRFTFKLVPFTFLSYLSTFEKCDVCVVIDHVLLDEIGFSADDLQELIHPFYYVCQRSTTVVSIVAPIRYAHLAASQVSQFLKYEDLSEISSGHGCVTSVGSLLVPELPKLHDRMNL
ncbi:hypothetical protein SOVF_193930, partial [Spinacia oleracea]